MLLSLTQHLPKAAVDLIRLSLWLVALTAIFVPLERVFAVHPAKIFRRGIGADLGYYFFSGLVASAILSVPLAAIASLSHEYTPWRLKVFIAEAPFWARALMGLVVGELGYYWAHRTMHTVPLLWRFHAIHHSPTHIDFLVNTRTHPLDLVFTRLCTYTPMYALGFAQPVSMNGSLVPIVFSLISFAWSFFIHANLRWRFGPLEWLISTPGYHHWHHALEPADRNYASVLPVFDFMFRTLHLPGRQWPERYGIHGTVPDSWTDQLVRPLLGSFPLAPGPNPSRASPEIETVA